MKNSSSNQFVISVGSNIDKKENIINRVIAHLDTIFARLISSSIYTTDALNGKDAPYSNCVVAYLTDDLSSEDIVSTLKQVERVFGRTPELKSRGIVPIDLDLVIYKGFILRERDFNYDYFQIGWNEIRQTLNLPM